jgi:adenosine deaminase
MDIKRYEEEVQMLKNAAAQSWQSESERNRLIEESVKLEIKILELKNKEASDH